MCPVIAKKKRSERDPSFDTIKGILIVLVVFGHGLWAYRDESFIGPVVQLIYSFHMPAFIFISGYFSKDRFEPSLFKGIIQILFAYIIFNSIMMLYCFTVYCTTPKLLTPYYSYWYLLALIWWRLSLPLIVRSPMALPATIALSLAVGFTTDISNQLALSRTIAFYPFFLGGYYFNKLNLREKVRGTLGSPRSSLAGAALIVLGSALAVLLIVRMELNTGDELMYAYADNRTIDMLRRLLLLLSATLITIGILMVVPSRPVPIITKAGRHSLTVYLFHRFVSLTCAVLYPLASTGSLIIAAISSMLTVIIFSSDFVDRQYRQFQNRALQRVAFHHGEKQNVGPTILILLAIAAILWQATC